MLVKSTCTDCKSKRVIVARDEKGPYVLCRGCFKEREIEPIEMERYNQLFISPFDKVTEVTTE